MELATARAAVLEIELQGQHLTLSANIGLSRSDSVSLSLTVLEQSYDCPQANSTGTYVLCTVGTEQHKASLMQSLNKSWLRVQPQITCTGLTMCDRNMALHEHCLNAPNDFILVESSLPAQSECCVDGLSSCLSARDCNGI